MSVLQNLFLITDMNIVIILHVDILALHNPGNQHFSFFCIDRSEAYGFALSVCLCVFVSLSTKKSLTLAKVICHRQVSMSHVKRRSR